VFSYYIVLSSIALTAFTLTARNIDNLVTNIIDYFLCEKDGFDPDHSCRQDLNVTIDNVTIVTLSYVLLAMFPAVNLIYVINVKELKDFIKKWLPRGSRKAALLPDQELIIR